MPGDPIPSSGDPIPSSVIPSCLDWADGINGHPGDPTERGAIIAQSSLGEADILDSPTIYQEFADSPEIERGEQATIQHRFNMDYGTGVTYLAGIGRGQLLIDDSGNITKVLTSRLVRTKANMATLTVTAEGVSFDTPPDEFRLEIVELNPALEKHPRYAFLPSDIRRQVNSAVSGSQVVTFENIKSLLSNIHLRTDPPPTGTDSDGNTWTTTWQVVENAALELSQKRFIGEDTFYLPGYRVVWSQYFWQPQLLNCGGYIEDPIDDGGLPPYFWSTDQTTQGLTIFDFFDVVNPQFYDQGISWLRMSDYAEYARTWFRITHTWLGSPYGHWDADLYSREPSPYPPPPQRPIS